MPTILQFNLCEPGNCSSLIFNDLTGPWSANNQSGYNGQNSDITSGATAQLTVTLANNTVRVIPMPGFPTTDKTKEFTITAVMLGYASGQKITDQIMNFVYQVNITVPTSSTLTQTIQKAFYCQADCCVRSMFLDLDISCEDCLVFASGQHRKAYDMLLGLQYSAGCLDVTTFNKTLAQLNKLCTNSQCKSCK